MSEFASHQIVLASWPHGLPEADNFRFERAAMPALTAGEVLLRVLFLSLDPYMRWRMDSAESYAKPAEIGDVMPGATLCSRQPAGAPTRRLKGLGCANSILRLRQLPRRLASSACRDSRPGPGLG
jgi:hypothetical protein